MCVCVDCLIQSNKSDKNFVDEFDDVVSTNNHQFPCQRRKNLISVKIYFREDDF